MLINVAFITNHKLVRFCIVCVTN